MCLLVFIYIALDPLISMNLAGLLLKLTLFFVLSSHNPIKTGRWKLVPFSYNLSLWAFFCTEKLLNFISAYLI